MGKDLIGYNTLVENGLRSVVREALRRVAEEGWPGSHHAYITFKTAAPGVEVPDFLHTRYPDELTIVLQHQFWDLEVGENSFSVTLSFNKVGQRIVVPFAALTSYADPWVKFGLQFGAQPEERGKGRKKGAPKARGAKAAPQEDGAEAGRRRGLGGAGRAKRWHRKRAERKPRPRRAARRSWRSTASARSSYSSHSRLPQTPISCPVMLRAASCARKNAASATSSQEISPRVEMKLT